MFAYTQFPEAANDNDRDSERLVQQIETLQRQVRRLQEADVYLEAQNRFDMLARQWADRAATCEDPEIRRRWRLINLTFEWVVLELDEIRKAKIAQPKSNLPAVDQTRFRRSADALIRG